MAWSNVSKPTTRAYTNVNPIGKEQYDQSDLTYDSASTFYDSVNEAAWTDISKPSTLNWTKINKPT
jgi:hypothetical protein